MPIQNIPYFEDIVNPLPSGWRSWLESVYKAVRGWRETEVVTFPNPFSGILVGAGTVATQTTTPTNITIDLGDTILLQPRWQAAAHTTMLFTVQTTAVNTLVWYAYNYGPSSVTLGSGDMSFKLIIFHQ